MTVTELTEKLGCTLLTPENGEQREVTGCYIGDLLSNVMGRASRGDAWVTIMTNINIVAVALLTEVSCIILSEDNSIEKEVVKKAAAEGIAVLSSPKTSYQLAVELSKHINA